VLACRHLRIVAQHASLLVDQAGDAARAPCGRVVDRAVAQREAPVRVAEERERKAELLREGRVGLARVEARAQDLRVQLLEIADSITESDALGRSAGSVGPREEPEEDLLPVQIPEADAASVVRRGREVGGRIAGLQHVLLLARGAAPRNHFPR